MTGNEAICLGALAAGVKFLAQYPMTPASSILHWMASHGPPHGVVVKQVEDELSAMNMAVGAGFAGVRSMTATSGGGFSLMVEAIGQAGMTETPLVAVLVQRSGPSTGLPTKTEQGDLNLALGAGQGDWPRAILAPRNAPECFTAIVKAFNLAEVYQTPVIVMSDLYLGEGFRTVERSELDFNVPILRGFLADGGDGKSYKRYQFTESGISPRAFPGMKGYQFTAGTDEHREKGILISDVLAGIPEWIEERRKMMDKRMRKLEGMRHELSPPELWGAAGADLTIVSWGSTAMTVREAIIRLAAKGYKVNALEFFDIYPFKAEETQEILDRVEKTLCVEGNFMGQFAHLLRAETGYKVDHMLTQYDGGPVGARGVVARATGAKLANPELTVIAAGGDGDGYGIGVGHFLHTMRRNLDITYIVMNNEIYGLTTGQASPTSEKEHKTKSTPEGVIENPINPLALAVASGATFVARGFSGDTKTLADVLVRGIKHKGFSLIDVMSPCVTYNKVNTYDWFKQRVYVAEKEGHNPKDLQAAMVKAMEWPNMDQKRDRVPTGVIYETDAYPTYEDQEPALKRFGPPVKQKLGIDDPEAVLKEFY